MFLNSLYTVAKEYWQIINEIDIKNYVETEIKKFFWDTLSICA